jgi:ribosomal protein L16 Arg81 hydroxylase
MMIHPCKDVTMDCRDVLSPLTVDGFRGDYWTSRYVVIPGTADKFDRLLTWEMVSDALQHTRFTPARLRLVRDGKKLDPAAYLRKPARPDGSLVRTPELSALLADGATLVMDAVDELFAPIGALADHIEDLFHVDVGANLYAGWRPQRGFDLHWDDHDALILQIAGKKHWQVYDPTTVSPLAGKAVGVVPKPQAPPVWDDILTSGSVLYMPRGWWHVACPVDGPSLHVTLAIVHQTGADIITWLASELLREIDVRADVPAGKPMADQREYARRLRTLVSAAVTDDVVERHIASLERQSRRRPRVSLPDVMLSRGVGIGPDTRLQLAVGKTLPMQVVDEGRGLRIVLTGGDLTVGAALQPALAMLHGSEGVTVRQMTDALMNGNTPALMPVLMSLVSLGVLLAQSPRN